MLLFEKDSGWSGPLRLLVATAVMLAVTLAMGSLAPAQTTKDPTGPAPPATPSALAGSTEGEPGEISTSRGPTDERDVEAFLDKCFARQLEDHEIPGATVSVVKDGEILVAKGYGNADVVKDKPVVADETLFPMASLSKLFTATAVMQLAEEGKLDLDEDVNVYLDDVEVPDTYPGEPVTLRHLLTHTAGFEDHFTGSVARDASDLDLGEHLSERMPARVRPPGEVMAYSNYGIALAGHVVEEASGVPFERYIEQDVLGPLGMESTTFAQPPPPELRDRLVTGYDIEDGRPVAAEFAGYPRDAPAAAGVTTATDMAAFMIAHLQDGRYGEARILEEATAREMHKGQFANHPRLDGMAYGFYEQTLNGERVIEAAGGNLQYHARVALVPERDVGIFVAYNSTGDGGDFAVYELLEAFLDRYYPEPPTSAAESPAEGTSGDAEALVGSYRPARSNLTGFEKVFTLLSSATVTANADGSITTSGVPSRKNLEGGEGPQAEQRWVEVAPLLFRAEGSDEHIAFRQDGAGDVEYMFGEALPPVVAYEKLAFYESPGLHRGLLAGSLAVFLLTVLAWPVGAGVSRWHHKRYGNRGEKPGWRGGAARQARLLAWAVSVLDLFFVVGMAMVISSDEVMAYGVSPLLLAVLSVPLLSLAFTAGVLVYAAMAWKRGYWGLFGRLHYSLVALSALAFIAVLGYYNLNPFGL
jgi:CubicO group peptidase (beta-lactamase class C family)